MVRRSLLTLAVLAALGLPAGCGSSASEPSPPAGVDLLTIPTPDPDPADFVRGVDNPWLPLAAGSTWTYEVTGLDPGELTVEVRPDVEVVAGVETTVVERTAPDGEVTTDYFAQDRDGNVWWFGRAGEFLAGEAGAEAGLAMPAVPRVGDGWRPASAPGVFDDTATVEGLEEEATTPAGAFAGLLVIESEGVRSLYGEGLGLVEEQSAGSVVALETATPAAGTPVVEEGR